MLGVDRDRSPEVCVGKILIFVFFLFGGIAQAQTPNSSTPQQHRAPASEQPSGAQVSPEQKHVWDGERNYLRYLQQKDLEDLVGLWDENFLGWPDYSEHPKKRGDMEGTMADEFNGSQTPAIPLPDAKPEGIAIFGDVAIAYYLWPDADKNPLVTYRISHTWQKGVEGWHIIGGIDCAVPRANLQPPSLPAAEQVRPSTSEVAIVKEREEAFRQAQLKYDSTSAKEILADEFIGTWNNGEQADKERFLSLIGDKADPLEMLEYGDMDVRIYGDAAVVWSTIHEKAFYGGKADEYRGRRTAVWVKRNAVWECVTIHTSQFAEAAH